MSSSYAIATSVGSKRFFRILGANARNDVNITHFLSPLPNLQNRPSGGAKPQKPKLSPLSFRQELAPLRLALALCTMDCYTVVTLNSLYLVGTAHACQLSHRAKLRGQILGDRFTLLRGRVRSAAAPHTPPPSESRRSSQYISNNE